MATVTETFIVERNDIPTPAENKIRVNAALSSGALISHTVTEITDPAQIVAGKIKFNIVRVWRSEEDRISYDNDDALDTEYLLFLKEYESRRINYTKS